MALLKGVHNVILPNNYPETLKIFLESDYFMYFIKTVVVLNLIGIFLIDYSFRTLEQPNLTQLEPINAASLCLQLFANCVFTLEIVMRCWQAESNLMDPYLLINMGGTFATYCCLTQMGLYFLQHDRIRQQPPLHNHPHPAHYPCHPKSNVSLSVPSHPIRSIHQNCALTPKALFPLYYYSPLLLSDGYGPLLSVDLLPLSKRPSRASFLLGVLW